MMRLTSALIGVEHGFQPILGGQLEAQGVTCLSMAEFEDCLEERNACATNADTRPHAPAMEVLHRLRQRSALPCSIILQQSHRDIDWITASEAGADDRTAQGAGISELPAHIRPGLCRPGNPTLPPRPPSAGWQIGAQRQHPFDAEGLPRDLNPAECDLLRDMVKAGTRNPPLMRSERSVGDFFVGFAAARQRVAA
jgi:DNA-binding response OmpR family regulator